MLRNRLIVLVLAFGFLFTSCDLIKSKFQSVKAAPGQVSSGVSVPSLPRIGGVYQASGTNPGGRGNYSGTATITPSGDSYQVHWEVGTIYDGIGKLEGKVFKVNWGPQGSTVGVVTYIVEDDGVLRGTWYLNESPKQLGTETLMPR